MRRRNFIRIGFAGSIGIGSIPISCILRDNDVINDSVIIVGGTPAGIMAAIASARSGNSVTMIEYQKHIGGMSSSGLGKSDVQNKEAIAGLFKEFTENVKNYYIDKYGMRSNEVEKCKDGYYYEPSVAELVFNRMVQQEINIKLILNHQIEKVVTEDNSITSIYFKDRDTQKSLIITGNIFIDCTYEGDVFSLAGSQYYVGRESRDDYGEEHAGQIFYDFDKKEILEGSTGIGDLRLPAYTYRLCLTDDPANSYYLDSPPKNYDRNQYLGYLIDLKEGRLSAPNVIPEGHGYYEAHFDTVLRAFSFTEIPNRKYDVNINPRPLAFPFVGENRNYIEGSWEQREKICQRHKELTLGLLYFIQNDPEVDEEDRKLANQYHLPKDEFIDNDHFPRQLYVREARRLKGKYVLTENDLRGKSLGMRNTIFEDSIISGEFPIDSFPVTNKPSANNKVLEGYIGLLPISPYQIPYRILIPDKIKRLIVPVAASTTHVAFSTVRMEPLWMGLGQVAGVAADMALKKRCEISDVPITDLQLNLIARDQVITYFEDVGISNEYFESVQFWGTKGFFNSYFARADEPITYQQFIIWNQIFINYLSGKKAAISDKVYEEDLIMTKNFFEKLFLTDLEMVLDQSKFSNIKNLVSSREWVLTSQNNSRPIKRGEACKAYFQIATEYI